MKDSFLSILRNKHTDRASFRSATLRLSHLLAAEATTWIEERSFLLQTPLGSCKGSKPSKEVVLIPILRSGTALLPSFLYFFSTASVGFLGIRREEKTAEPILYYENLPPLSSSQLIFLLDPMLATAGSALLAVEKILQKGAKEKHLHLFGIIAAASGVKALQSQYPNMHLHLAAVDKKINSKKFIFPGLGDFGDRFFGTL